MPDNRSPESRSALMARIMAKNTQPEWIVRRLMHGMGFRYRLHRRNLPGSPDLIFPSKKKAVFVHGCFWHAHGCKIGRPPKSRPEFWLPKLARNKERDELNDERLRALGYDVLTVWQCETRRPEELAPKLRAFMEGLTPQIPIDTSAPKA